MSGIDPSGMSEATQALLWVIGLLASGGGCYMLGAKKKVLYDGGKPIVIMDVVCSHKTRDVSEVRIHTKVEVVIRETLATIGLLTNETRFHINPTGRFLIGGPAGDSGVTGREIIMDTHGRWDYDGYGCDLHYKRRVYTWRDAV